MSECDRGRRHSFRSRLLERLHPPHARRTGGSGRRRRWSLPTVIALLLDDVRRVPDRIAMRSSPAAVPPANGSEHQGRPLSRSARHLPYDVRLSRQPGSHFGGRHLRRDAHVHRLLHRGEEARSLRVSFRLLLPDLPVGRTGARVRPTARRVARWGRSTCWPPRAGGPASSRRAGHRFARAPSGSSRAAHRSAGKLHGSRRAMHVSPSSVGESARDPHGSRRAVHRPVRAPHGSRRAVHVSR